MLATDGPHELLSTVGELKTILLGHPLFSAIQSKEQLCHFMQAHVYAVWDFMSLVKRLQAHFAPVTIPWQPPRDPMAARLINEIALGEESDRDIRGGYAPHFQLYLGAMREIGANTDSIDDFMRSLPDLTFPVSAKRLHEVLCECRAPLGASDFVTYTLNVAQNGTIEEVMGAFFFGREELVPQLFESLLSRWGISRHVVPTFAYYLDRHIQLDREEHGPLASALIDRWVGQDFLRRTALLKAACAALKARIALWDRVLEHLPQAL